MYSGWKDTGKTNRMAETEGTTRTPPSDFRRLPRFEATSDFKSALFAGAGVALTLSVAALLTLNFLDTSVLAPLSIYLLLMTAILFTSGWVVGLRMEIRRADARDPETPRESDASEKEARKPAATGIEAKEELERFGRLGAPVLLALGGLAGMGFSSILLGEVVQSGVKSLGGGSPPATDGTPIFVAGVLVGLLAFPFLVLDRVAGRIGGERLPEAPGLVLWFRGGQWAALITGLVLALRGLGFEVGNLTGWLILVLFLLTALAALEMLARALGRIIRTRQPWHAVLAPVHLVTLTTLFHGRNPVDGLLEVAEKRFGLTLRTSLAFAFLRKSLVPLMILMAFILWIFTALVVVGPGEEGVRLRFGRLVSRTPVGPGLAWKLPWPLETIERYSTQRVQTLILGYSGRRRPTLLWTEAHTGVQYKMLLGDGRELVSVEAVVAYRIKNVIDHVLNNQDPRAVLDALAYRQLMQKTVVTSLDALLSVNRDRISTAFTRNLQTEVDARGLGMEILHTSFVSLHPPAKIAPEYQAVVGAQIARETQIIRAEVDRANSLPAAEAEVKEEVLSARADADMQRAEARGATVRYLAGLEAHKASPDLFEFRRWLEAVEEGLANRNLFILDPALRDALSTGSGGIWLDLRSGTRKRQ